MKKTFTLQLLALLFLLLLSSPNVFAEGTEGLSPTEDDKVMLLVNDPNYGYFAGYNAPENSRLYFTVNDASEVVYLGFSGEYNASGTPQGLGFFEYRIRRKSDGAVVFGPYSVTAIDANLSSWQDAMSGPAPITGADGYDVSDAKYQFVPQEAGDYFIEFSGLKYLGLWDITVAKGNVAQSGRVWSRNWAFRTPATTNELPECVWSKEFNAVLYSYTTDGFVSKVDFNNSGFQGLSFNVAFNTRGPRNTGDAAFDRQSVANINLTDNAGEHKIFLNEPDANVFPDGECGAVEVADYFNCDGESGYCIPVTVTNPGLVELTLDFNGNGVFDEGTEDVLLLHNFVAGELSYCLPWDGLKGNGETVDFGETVSLEYAFFQGVQHWSVYDGEYLKNGFCVEVIRPICDPEIVINSLHWDDRNIPEDPGTGQPKDGRLGCSCQNAGCRTWNNFDPHIDDCSDVDDNLTTGYGDKSTLNTWWYASIKESVNINVPILTSRLTVQISGDDELICQGEQVTLQVEFSTNATITSIEWYGPNGLITTTPGNQLTLNVVGGGDYQIIATDEFGCHTSSTVFVDEIVCPVDLELDKTVDNATPQIGDQVTFTITVTNNGPGGATGVSIVDEIPSGYTNINLGANSNAMLNGNTITWSGLVFDVGATQSFTYSVTVGYGVYTNAAQITTTNEEDIDSTPGNGVDTDNDGDCSDDDGDEDDGDCVEVIPIPCSISATVSNLLCDQNGTPSIPDDDTYFFSVVLSGESTFGGWTSDNGISGTYDEVITFGPYSIANQPQTSIVFTDNGDASCSTSITVDAPETCSNECEILIGDYNTVCDENGTPSFNEDDIFYVYITVDGRNIGEGWTSSGGSGTYGEETQLGPFLIADGDFSLVINDANDINCTAAVLIEAPSPCSNACAITDFSIVGTDCSDNGTPSIAADDIFYATINVSGVNISGGWTSIEGFSGNYNEDVTIGPFDIAEGVVTLHFVDNADSECTAEFVITAPESCSPQCEILGEVVGTDCRDNGTPSIADDDVFWVTVQMTGYNLGNNWQTDGGASGAYGEAVEIGPFDISAGDVTITFFDENAPDCSISLQAEAPSTCSDQCAIFAEVLGVECGDLGDDQTGFDDEFVYSIRVNGYNLSDEGWIASDGTSGGYGEEVTSVGHLIADGDINLTIADGDDSGCIAQVIIHSPELEITCPEDTDEGVFRRPVQVLSGDLSPSDDAFVAGDSLCWLPAANNGGHYYDMVSFHVSDEVDEYERFTFVLYTDMVLQGNSIEGLPENMYEGFGGLFFEEYMFDEPCCTVQNVGDHPVAVGEELYTPLTVNVSGIVPEGYHPVLSFSVPLQEDKDYTLVTTTWTEQMFGHYKWVVVSKEESPIIVNDSDEFEFTEVLTDVAYRLTFFDLADDMTSLLPPINTGMPETSMDCGLDEMRYEDTLLVVDECEDATVTRHFTLVDVNGNETDCSQEIVFHRPTLDDVFFPPMTVHFGCGDTYETDADGNPLPSETGYPFIFTTSGVEELTVGAHENVGVGIKDFEENENGELVTITREWTIVDLCDNDTLARFEQLIKFDNYEMPTMVCPMNNHNCPFSEDGTMLIPTTAYDCFASANIPMPEFEGGCGDTTNFEITTEVFKVIDGQNELIATILPGADRFVAGMELGNYVIRYFMEDFEGATQELFCNFRVVDLTEPVAICNSNLSVSLSEVGQAFVPVSMINNASYDNCGIDSILIRRIYTRDLETCDSLSTPIYSEWGDHIEIGCCDANQRITVELRVVDVSGNVNMCWSFIDVVDNTLPYCFGLADETVDCEILPYYFNANNTNQLQTLFGLPQVYDNCTAEAVELEPIANLSRCGTGTIIRRFIAIDLVGQQSQDTFFQVVTLEGDLRYEIKFPKDATTDCIHSADTLELYHPGCDSLVVFYNDEISTNTGNDACYLVQRTYHVINYCEWDGISPPVTISRDENCNGQQGEEDVWVLVRPDVAYIDKDSIANNTNPAMGEKGTSCDGNSNPEGIWRTSVSTGHWIYRQQLEVYDTIAPVVIYDIPNPFCTDTLVCTADVILEFSIEEACMSPVEMTVAFDAFSDGVIDEENVVYTGDYPNFAIAGTFDIGVHQFIVTVSDACNSATVMLPFEVVDCEIPAIDCQSGLLLNLQAIEPNTDADGDGDIDEGAVEVWAYDLAGCNQDDCSGPYHFSVNRVGQIPDENQESLMLTCDDRYSISLEVYVWDDAYNPYRIQPDGSVGGPNYDHCTVYILLQDPDNVCHDCVDALELTGEIYTPETFTPIEGVEVKVSNYTAGQMFTDFEGKYLVGNLELEQDYTLTPKLDENPKQGVTTVDIIAIHRHILNQIPITSPYSLLAADVNRSGSITFLDIVEIKKLLLGDLETFQNSDSWMFVDAKYDFPNPGNPWQEVFPEYIVVNNVQNCTDSLDFFGVKVGDVNNSALLVDDDVDRTATTPYILSGENAVISEGENVEISLHAEDFNSILGGQFALRFDAGALAYDGMDPGVAGRQDVGLAFIKDGLIKVIWDNVEGQKYHSDVLLTLHFIAKRDGQLQDMISLSERDLRGEVYTEDLSARPVRLSFESQTDGLTVLQNKPNPFRSETTIVYELLRDAEVLFQVTDVTGKIVYQQRTAVDAGQHIIKLDKKDLPTSGVYYYSLSDGHSVVIRPMVLIR